MVEDCTEVIIVGCVFLCLWVSCCLLLEWLGIFCIHHKPETGFQTSYVVVYSMFNWLRWEFVVWWNYRSSLFKLKNVYSLFHAKACSKHWKQFFFNFRHGSFTNSAIETVECSFKWLWLQTEIHWKFSSCDCIAIDIKWVVSLRKLQTETRQVNRSQHDICVI